MLIFELILKTTMVGLGLLVVNARNPVYSVFSLILLFLFSAFLLVYVGASFIGMVFLVVYIGAVAILFLFVVMMINIRYVELTSRELYYLPINGLLLIPLSLELLTYFKFGGSEATLGDDEPIDYMRLYTTIPDSEVLGALLYGFEFGFAVLLASLILFVAMIGSIVLTFNIRYDVKKQNLYDQLSSGFFGSVYVYDLKPVRPKKK